MAVEHRCDKCGEVIYIDNTPKIDRLIKAVKKVLDGAGLRYNEDKPIHVDSDCFVISDQRVVNIELLLEMCQELKPLL